MVSYKQIEDDLLNLVAHQEADRERQMLLMGKTFNDFCVLLNQSHSDHPFLDMIQQNHQDDQRKLFLDNIISKQTDSSAAIPDAITVEFHYGERAFQARLAEWVPLELIDSMQWIQELPVH